MTTPSNNTDRSKNVDTLQPRELGDVHAEQPELSVEAALWAVRQQDGMRAEEEAELQAWLQGDPARTAKLDRMKGLLGQLDDLPAEARAALRLSVRHTPLAASAATAQASRLPVTSQAHLRREARRPERGSRLFPATTVAGMLIAALVGGGFAWNHWQQQPTFAQSFVTPRGQKLTASLPDASKLLLDTRTDVDVRLYRQRREVLLRRGQAQFDVAADPSRPFHVLAGGLRVSVVGTRFSVRHDASDATRGQVRVVVEEGRVRVAALSSSTDSTAPGEAALELSAGQAVVLDHTRRLGPVTKASERAANAWRDGRLVFDDTPLGVAISEFERYADTGLVVRDPAVAALRVNGSFDLRQVQSFVRALPQALPVRLQPRADGTTEVVPAPN